MGAGAACGVHPRRISLSEMRFPGRLEAHHEPPLRDGADPYDLVGIVTLCRGCHIEHHRLHDETPGRAAWRALVDGMIKS